MQGTDDGAALDCGASGLTVPSVRTQALPMAVCMCACELRTHLPSACRALAPGAPSQNEHMSSPARRVLGDNKKPWAAGFCLVLCHLVQFAPFSQLSTLATSTLSFLLSSAS